MDENQRLERICKRLLDVNAIDWKEDYGRTTRLYAEIGGVRFYLSSRTEKETDFQDGVLVGEGESSEVVNLRIPTDVKYVTIEIVDTTTNTTFESYERRHDLPLSLYSTVRGRIGQQLAEEHRLKEQRCIAEGRNKLDRILGLPY
ncbi:MAG: hypothetical protein HY518_05440 [Candidatus Aenigmarchaeota archaeon]|nr:hypothetical protein [Candidatus Aenigmarchaeota archaeon]